MKKLLSTAIAATTMLAANAHAALPPEVATGFTGLKADAAELFGYAWPVILFVLAGFIAIKLTKRTGNAI